MSHAELLKKFTKPLVPGHLAPSALVKGRYVWIGRPGGPTNPHGEDMRHCWRQGVWDEQIKRKLEKFGMAHKNEDMTSRWRQSSRQEWYEQIKRRLERFKMTYNCILMIRSGH